MSQLKGDDLEIGALVAKIDTSVEAPAETPVKKEEQAPAESSTAKVGIPESPAPSKSTYASGHPSPAANKILAEKRN